MKYPASPAQAEAPGVDGSSVGTRVLLVGCPNVGKSALFNRLTGQYVTVSNYPGTTVEVARGHCHALGRQVEIIDTPGMYSLLPITEEERVGGEMLLEGGLRAVVHVVDAKNLERMLGFTLQLMEAGFPVILALNMFDEVRSLGIQINVDGLRARLGIPVIPTVSVTGEGLANLIGQLRHPPAPTPVAVEYGDILEEAIVQITQPLTGSPSAEHTANGDVAEPPRVPVAPRAWASLLLQGDERQHEWMLRERSAKQASEILAIVSDARRRLNHSPHYYVSLALRARASRLVAECVVNPTSPPNPYRRTLDRVLTNPLTGFPILVAVLYLALFKFVGGFGAGTLVDLLERNLFGNHITPWIRHWSEALLPWIPVRNLVAGEYGILTLGLRYAVALILPIVTTFFFAFAILEDSGYLPRLALLVDRLFKRIGLNGRAVIPMVLGFGCDTMATLVTRTLETRRERIICTILLALAIPCSAQLGVILGLLAGHPAAFTLWAGVVFGIMLLTGFLAARVMPGSQPMFYMELPPLRWPSPSNVLVKTYSRMVWYFREILPTFLLASVLIWLGQITTLFQLILRALQPVVHSVGLPGESAVAFLFGFFRRDYGAAGLYDLHRAGGLTVNQLTVATIALTLFLPCVAQFLVMQKERGTRVTLWISVFVIAVAYSAAWLTHTALTVLGVTL